MLVILLIISIVFIVVSTTKFKLHPFLALLMAAIGFGLFSGMPLPDIIEAVNGGFGNIYDNLSLMVLSLVFASI